MELHNFDKETRAALAVSKEQVRTIGDSILQARRAQLEQLRTARAFWFNCTAPGTSAELQCRAAAAIDRCEALMLIIETHIGCSAAEALSRNAAP